MTTALLDLEPLRSAVTEETLIGVCKTLAARCNAAEPITPEEAANVVRALALLNAAEETYAVLSLDIYVRSGGLVTSLVKEARALRKEDGIDVWLSGLKDALLGESASGRDVQSFYGEGFQALNTRVSATLEGLEVKPHEPPA